METKIKTMALFMTKKIFHKGLTKIIAPCYHVIHIYWWGAGGSISIF